MLLRILFATALATLIIQPGALSALAEPSEKLIGILLAAGDIAECKDNPKGRPADGYRQQQTADLLGKEIADAKMRGIPIRVLALGDLAYVSGKPDEFENCFHQSWGQHIKFILPVPGNHEYKSKDAAPYFAYFEKHGAKMVSENSPPKGPKAGYYSLNFPASEELPGSGITPWHLIALNSKNGEVPPPNQIDWPKNQLDWLKKDLKANGQRCVLAFAHFFAFSSSRHGHEPPDFKRADETNSKKPPKPNPIMVDILQTLYANGASLLLSAHDHGYEQFKRQDGSEQFKGQDSRHNLVTDGVRSFVVGTGGATFYKEAYKHQWPNSEKGPSYWHGILKLELFESRYRWRFVPIDKVANDVPAELKAPTEEDCNTRKHPS